MQFLSENKSNKGVVFSFGRLSPPTIGHEKMIQKIFIEAKKRNFEPHLYLSHSYDLKKNPLTYDEKFKFIARGIPGAAMMLRKSSAKTPFEVLEFLNSKNYSHVVMVVGSDRLEEFKSKFKKYNDLYNFSIEVISAGERDPDGDEASAASGTAMRDAVMRGSYLRFKKMAPSKLSDQDTKEMFNLIRNRLGIKENFFFVHDSLGIPRYKMPQIRSDSKKEYFDYLKNKNIEVVKKKIPLQDLRCTQRELNTFNVEYKIEKMKKSGKVKPIIVSQDGYVLDGHHSFQAARIINNKALYPCFVVMLNIKDLMSLTCKFKKAEFEEFQ